MRPGKVVLITTATVIGWNFLAKRSATARKVWTY